MTMQGAVFNTPENKIKDTYVTLVLDETGSMMVIKDDTIGGYNEYIDSLKKSGLPFFFTLLKWDSVHTEIVHRGVPITEVPPLTAETYKPGAGTPLIDVCVKAILATEQQVYGKDVNVAFVIQTDGQENASVEFTMKDLNALIKDKTALGWSFIFLGVGLDAFAQAGAMGIARGQTLGYEKDKVSATFAAAAASNVRYGASGQSVSSSFTDDERKQAGGNMPEPAGSFTAVNTAKPLVDDLDFGPKITPSK